MKHSIQWIAALILSLSGSSALAYNSPFLECSSQNDAINIKIEKTGDYRAPRIENGSNAIYDFKLNLFVTIIKTNGSSRMRLERSAGWRLFGGRDGLNGEHCCPA